MPKILIHYLFSRLFWKRKAKLAYRPLFASGKGLDTTQRTKRAS
jgi:hypothetical protein